MIHFQNIVLALTVGLMKLDRLMIATVTTLTMGILDPLPVTTLMVHLTQTVGGEMM